MKSKEVKFDEIRLGDFLILNSEPRTVRGIIPASQLPYNIKGYLLLGELDYILEVNSNNQYCSILSPSTIAPNSGQSVMEGAISYYAPHLPPVGGAMGELLFRVVISSGYSEPILIIYRNNELIAFYKYDTVNVAEVIHEKIRKSKACNSFAARYAAIVNPPNKTDNVIERANSSEVSRIIKKTKRFFS